jgi:hypothetical protein
VGRLDDVLSTFEDLFPHLFMDPPDMEKYPGRTAAVGRALLRAGDRQRGEPFLRYILDMLERQADSSEISIAQIDLLLYLGETDAAIDGFKAQDDSEKVTYGGLGPRFLVQNNPVWAPIRATPEYAALMEELDRTAAGHREKLQAMDLPLL